MWTKTLYYTIKPLVPRRLQIELRRMVVRRQLKRHRDVWPIDRNSAKPPQGWSGWPDGKQFALVLTHDVETALGQERCRDIMRLEKQMGFRSSFNFVPERYDVSAKLRHELTQHGFEVGVHGLYHDGKYYTSRKIFRERAVKINRYLREWDAAGYRSPSMLCNLEWMHDLNIEYDTTFDTDPLSPSRGHGHHLPFWCPEWIIAGVCRTSYTLPRTTRFVIMRENDRYLEEETDWIAQHGGMALLTTHPDYMKFNGDRNGLRNIPPNTIKSFLNMSRSGMRAHCRRCEESHATLLRQRIFRQTGN
jgi:hypothetical protein